MGLPSRHLYGGPAGFGAVGLQVGGWGRPRMVSLGWGGWGAPPTHDTLRWGPRQKNATQPHGRASNNSLQGVYMALYG